MAFTLHNTKNSGADTLADVLCIVHQEQKDSILSE